MIGGGDTGTDCVGTSMRQGCRSLTQLEILPQPPLDRADDNPWPEWPKVYKLDYGQEEAAAKFGADPRVYLTTVKQLRRRRERARSRSSSRCRSSGGRTRRVSSCRSKCRARERTHPAQLVLLAMGFLGPEQALLEAISRVETRRTHEREGRARQVRDQPPGRLRRRRLPPRAEPRRVGDQRRPRRGARMRPLPDGPDRTTVTDG